MAADRHNDGRARVVLIEGEAGVGKTRLLDEFCARVGAVLRASCYPGEAALAYSPVRELLEAAAHERGIDRVAPGALSEAARLVTRAGAGAPARAGVARLPRRADPLPRRGGGGPGDRRGEGDRRTVVLDDVQWLDSASAELLGFLLHRPQQ